MIPIPHRPLPLNIVYQRLFPRLEKEGHTEPSKPHSMSSPFSTHLPFPFLNLPTFHLSSALVLSDGACGRPHAVHSSNPPPPTYLRHQIADINDEGAGDVGRGDPDAGGVEDFETAGGVLVEEGEDAGVGLGLLV